MLAMSIVVLLTACEAPKEIGLPPEVIAEVKFTDTVTVRTSTVLLDSVRTSNTLSFLVGKYNDPTFGQVTARPYFELIGAPSFTSEGKTYIYDSLALQINYSYLYGDTLKPFEMGVHRLKDTIRTNRNYYNISVIDAETEPIAKAKFTPGPNQSRSITIKLPNTLGKAMFDALNKNEITSADQFRKTFRGFTLIPSSSNNAIIGFGAASADVRMTMHVHESTSDTLKGSVSFNVFGRFNNVQSNRQGTAISQLQPLKPLPASQTRGMTYLHDALGVVNKVEFPYLSRILQNKEIAINRAELTIVPNQPANIANGVVDWPNYLHIPSGLALIETDETNRVLRTTNDRELFIPIDGTTFQPIIQPQVSLYSTKFRQYDSFILTTYLQAILTGFKKSNGLLLMPISFPQVAGVNNLTGRFQPYLQNRINGTTITPTRNNLKLMLFYTTTK
jgi:hypothetical protein